MIDMLDVAARKREAHRLTSGFSKQVAAIAEAYRKRATKDVKRARWGVRSHSDTTTLIKAELLHRVREFYRIGGCIMDPQGEPVLDVADVEVGVEITEDEVGAHLMINIRPSAEYLERVGGPRPT